MAGFFDDNDVIDVVAAPKQKPASNSFFDSADVIEPPSKELTVPPVADSSVQTGTPQSKFFDSADVVARDPSTDPGSNTNELQTKEPDSKSTSDKSIIDQSDIDTVAAKYKVDPERLRSLAPYFNVNTLAGRNLPEAIATGVKGVAGKIASSALLNIPQALVKDFALDPQTNKALEELGRLSNSREPVFNKITDVATDLAMPIAGVNAINKLGTAGRIVANAGLGSIAGAAGADSGERVKGAAIGGVVGGTLGTAVEGAIKLFSRPGGKLIKAEQELLNKPIDPLLADKPRSRDISIDEIEQKISDSTKESEEVLQKIVSGRTDELTAQDAKILVDQQIPEESLNKLLSPDTTEHMLMMDRIKENNPLLLSDKTAEEAIRIQLAEDIAEKRILDFASDLSKSTVKDTEKAQEVIKEFQNRQGLKFTLEDKYPEFVKEQNFLRAVTEDGIRARNPTGTAGYLANKVSGAQFVMQHIDNKYGTQLQRDLSDLNKDINRSTYVRKAFRDGLEAINNKALENGADATIRNSDKLVQAIEQGSPAGLTQGEKEVAGMVVDEFAKVRAFANNVDKETGTKIAPLAIPKVENYVTRVALPVNELIQKVEDTTESALQQLSQELGRKIENLGELSSTEYAKALTGNSNVTKLIEFVNWKDSAKNIPNTAQLLESALSKSTERGSARNILDKVSRATLERTGMIPDFIREKNLYKILDRYTYDVLKSLYTRQGLLKMQKTASKLDAVGANVEAKYVNDLITDVLGTRSGTIASGTTNILNDAAASLNKSISEAKNPITRSALQTIKGARELPGFFMRQIYPNVLGGFKLKPILENMLSGFTKTAPLLGTKYGTLSYIRGMTDAVLNFNERVHQVHFNGFAPEDFIKQGERALSEGIRNSKIVDKSIGAIEGINKAMFSVYSASEKLNRAAIYGMSKMVVSDLQRGSKMALNSLQEIPFQMRKDLLQSVRTSDWPEVERKLSGYLLDVGAFNYNRASMFELGRDLGPLFSTFSKWPSEVLGDVLSSFRDGGILKGMSTTTKRFVGTYLMFLAADKLLEKNTHLADNDVYKKLTGGGGLRGMTPGSSLVTLGQGERFTPPIVDALVKGIIVPAVNGDGGKLTKGLDSMFQSYFPLTGVARFITDDAVTYATGRKPEGSTFIERTARGADTIDRKLSK